MFRGKFKLHTILLSSLLVTCEQSDFHFDMSASPIRDIRENQKNSRIQMDENQLWIDGEAQPQLFGAELQYFRLRGGQGPNIPREKVLDLWNKALDRMVEAGMNVICFYIPWDFHEYEEGKFDFTGSVDQDKDGRPDFPSRDIVTFFKLIEEKGIKKIMVRPGPYINAEWGPLGFGAIPLWFHQKYGNVTHMKSAQGFPAKLYDYHNADLLRHTKLWFEALHEQVLKGLIGPDKPVFALQIDNETNFMWQPIYNVDYSAPNLDRYRFYLQHLYGMDLEKLNKAHGRQWKSWREISAPVRRGDNVAEDHDWYGFQDFSIFHYLKKIQSFWYELGVTHKEVLFTLAESYNAAPQGLIPHYAYRNHPATGMMTVNLYPKTFETPSSPLLNNPFKADHDVRFADASNDLYFPDAKKNEWVLGPEIQGGWWRGIPVSYKARQQTYLTTLGHGLKALFVYYFTEGDNWYGTWEKEQVQKLYQELRTSTKYKEMADHELGDAFWNDLRDNTHSKFFANLDPRWILGRSNDELNTLFFDAPLDNNAEARENFQGLKVLGDKIVKPYGAWLGKAVELTDDVVFIKDPAEHAPQVADGLDNVLVNTDWSAGLFAYLNHAGYNPQTHVFMGKAEEIPQARVWIRQDYVYADAKFVEAAKRHLESGGVIVNFLEDKLAEALGVAAGEKVSPAADIKHFHTREGYRRDSSLYTIERLPSTYARAYKQLPANCQSLLRLGDDAVAYACPVKGGGTFVQISASLHDIFNHNTYFEREDLEERNAFLRSTLARFIAPRLEVVGSKTSSKVSLFARRALAKEQYWLTLKSGHNADAAFKIKVSLAKSGQWSVKNVLTGDVQELSADELRNNGVGVRLGAHESTALYVERNEAIAKDGP
jgi:hypothetical protein